MMPSTLNANNNSNYTSYYEDAEDSYDAANHTTYMDSSVMNGFHNEDDSNISATTNNLNGIKSGRVATGFGV